MHGFSYQDLTNIIKAKESRQKDLYPLKFSGQNILPNQKLADHGNKPDAKRQLSIIDPNGWEFELYSHYIWHRL